MPPQVEEFRHASLQEQLSILEAELTSQRLPELLLLCSELADSAPLLFLVKKAQERGIVLDESLGDVLLKLSTSSLHKLLQLPGLELPVRKAWTRAGVQQLVSFALLDRYLRRRAPGVWQDCLRRIAHLTRQKLQSEEAPDERLTLRLQGAEQKKLSREYPQAWQAWSQAWEETARKALHTLASRPRDVSLANAERLLSQQVYTDQGHFLLELLQNADDAGASFFEVEFRADTVIVSHNGVPFDFRDLVGVLSIGQTTKTERQIGYFGVGFKSVFEVTERPLIFSGHFAFEIVDISVPRYLSARDNDPEKTTLHLPLKPGLTVEPYYRRALEIEPTLLLNLPNVRRLKWTGPDGTTTELTQSQDQDLHTLTRTISDGESQKLDFLVWRGRYQHRGERPEGKPTEAHLMLAFPRNHEGIPGGNLYSFLPIQEDSGLRFLIGSHFDVPVDRERLDQTSLWNRGILRTIPDLIVKKCQHAPEILLSLLRLLPLPEDTVGPLFRTLSAALAQKFREVPFLPSLNGHVKAEQAMVLESTLAPLFTEQELEKFLQPADDRTRRWLELLGARTFDLKSLLRDITRGNPPARLLKKDLSAWQLFHKSLLQDPSFEAWESQLKSVPLLLDEDGKMAAARGLTLLSPEWEAVFENRPATVWRDLRTLPETSALIASLEIRSFDWNDLIAHLKEHRLSKVRPAALFEHLAGAPRQIQLSVLRLPLFRSESHRDLPLRILDQPQDGFLVTREDTPKELFPELEFCTGVELLEPLLEAVRWPWFDRSQALMYLSGRRWQPDLDQAEKFCRWLLGRHPEWATLEDLLSLAGLPVFLDRSQQLRPLGELWNYQDPELEGLLPNLPQLDAGSTSSEVVTHFGLQHLLGQAGVTTLIENLEQQEHATALEFLSGRAQELSRQQISRLLKQPLWSGMSVAHGEHLAGEGVLEVADPSLIDLFLDLGQQVAPPQFSRSVIPLLEAAGFQPLGLKRLVELLQEKTPRPQRLPELHNYLSQHSIDLHLGYSKSVLQSLKVWLCFDGSVRSALEIPPSQEMAELLALEYALPASDQPQILLETIPLLDPAEFLLERVKAEAKPREKLDLQPAWLNTVSSVDRVARRLSHHHLCVDHKGRLYDTKIPHAPSECHSWVAPEHTLLHPESSPWQVQRADHLPAHQILRLYLPYHQDAAIRADFYHYLNRHLGQIVREQQARDLLLSEPIWPSAGGNWHRLEHLVLEGGLPELGYDWTPHREIPEELLDQLKTTLDVGRSDPASLLSNLLNGYQQRVRSGEDGSELLKAMAKVSEPLTGEAVREVVEEVWPSGEFPVYKDGGYLPLHRLYAPPDPLSALLAVRPVAPEQTPFLRKVGLAHVPSVDSLQAAGILSPQDAQALEELVAWCWEERPVELQESLVFLRGFPWVRDRRKEVKAPIQLYMPTSEMQELVGDAAELYPLSERPAGLWRALGVREERDLTLTPVLQNLVNHIREGRRISSRFYGFLENALQAGSVSPEFLKSSLAELSWVWTDEGEYRPPEQVLGVPAYRYFGPHRGTWERAPELYPNLARVFEIPAALGPEVVLRFLRQISEGRLAPPSTRLIRNCLALLAEQQALLPRDWKVLPARQWPEGTEVLVSVSQAGVVRSNSPTLAALFGQGGTLWVVETDDPEHGAVLEELYERQGIPRLRDSYTVHTDASGSDVTEAMGDCVSAFRKLLSAIDAVLPRLRAARPEWEEGEWLAETHLRPFTTAAPICVIDQLLLVYTLPGVSSVKVTASIAYDPEKHRLILSAAAIQEPQMHAVELAEGLVECIYQGPGSENLIDLLNLLLLFGNEKSMNSYLDQRHFPRPFVESGPGNEGWRKRLGEILDYGLHQVLERRYPELEGARWEAWRDSSWQPSEGTARECLAQVGVHQPSKGLLEELEAMLESPVPGFANRHPEPAAEPQALRPVTLTDDPQAPELPPEAGFSVARLGKKLFNRLNDWLAKEPMERPALGLKELSLDLAENYQHPPERHLLVNAKDLQLHNLYCLGYLCSDFHHAEQEYRPGWKDWKPLFLPSGQTVQFSGSFAAGSFPLPKPLYSRLTVKPEGRLSGPDEFQQYRLELQDVDARLHYEVELSATPDYKSGTYLPDPDPRLLKPTSALEHLPVPVRDWIDWGQYAGLPHWLLAERAVEFVMGAYQYDLGYLGTEAAQQVVKRPARAGENKFLSVLHAGESGRILGRGVCSELSAILLEILRHCNVPCAIARVWMLDQGLIHILDHAIVLALVPTPQGPFWLPLDPSGQRVVVEQAEPEKPLTRLELLEKAARILLSEELPEGDRQRLLEERLLSVFGDKNLLELYLDCLAKPGRYRRELGPEFEELRARGYLEISEEQMYQVWVKG